MVPGERFAQQMAWLAEHGYRGTAVRELMEQRSVSSNGGKRPHPRSIGLTFDDGYLDNYAQAWSVLKQHQFTATILLVTDFVGKHAAWEEPSKQCSLLDWAQAVEMITGGMEVGSHTATHLDIRQATIEQIREELLRSRDAIAEHTGQAPKTFAYPYGYWRPEMPGLLAEAGYQWGLLAATWGCNGPDTDPYCLHRVPVWGDDTLLQFAAKVRGWYRWRHYTDKMRDEARWLLKKLSRG
ncbi:MAG: polysaccharide deacetylase family protein [Armatimonadetes bacterium]|nr:polysaccharide deacetylase family protein [Armatimonadota bacterium]